VIFDFHDFSHCEMWQITFLLKKNRCPKLPSDDPGKDVYQYLSKKPPLILRGNNIFVPNLLDIYDIIYTTRQNVEYQRL